MVGEWKRWELVNITVYVTRAEGAARGIHARGRCGIPTKDIVLKMYTNVEYFETVIIHFAL